MLHDWSEACYRTLLLAVQISNTWACIQNPHPFPTSMCFDVTVFVFLLVVAHLFFAQLGFFTLGKRAGRSWALHSFGRTHSKQQSVGCQPPTSKVPSSSTPVGATLKHAQKRIRKHPQFKHGCFQKMSLDSASQCCLDASSLVS